MNTIQISGSNPIPGQIPALVQETQRKCTYCEVIKEIHNFEIRKGVVRKRCRQCCDITEKECLGCHIMKPVDDFYKTGGQPKPRCKQCSYEQNKKYPVNMAKKREYMKEYMRGVYLRAKGANNDNNQQMQVEEETPEAAPPAGNQSTLLETL